MKNTKTCPKCQSKDILRLKDTGYATAIKMGAFDDVYYFTRFVCVGCGYAEQWMESPDERANLRKKHKPD